MEPETKSGAAVSQSPEGGTKDPDTPPRSDPRPRRRIAQKLLLLYFLPVSVLIIAGVGLPLLQWNFFGATIREYNDAVHFAEQAAGMQKSASDIESLYRAFVLSREPTRLNGRRQIMDARQDYSQYLTQVDSYIETRHNDDLRAKLDMADHAYRKWNRAYVDPELLLRPLFAPSHRPDTTPEFQANLSRVAFISVQRGFNEFTRMAEAERDAREAQAHTATLLRQLSAILFPLGAFLLSALIGRSIAVSITRPLEDLTRASEELEQGGSVPLLAAEHTVTSTSDDEIGDLQQSFTRMARTIGQREAMLRAQNEALGALNQRIESVLNATNDAILMLDRAGAFSVVNQRFADLFGIEADVLLDQTFAQAAPLLFSRFKKRQEARERLERLLADPQDVAEENLEVIEPTPRILRLFSAPVRGEQDNASEREIIGRILVFRDVTREMLVDRMKTEFVSTVSHELRTPLTAITGYVDLMVSGQTGTLNQTQTEFLTMVQGSTKRLTALINDLLDISRIESGRIDIKQESVDYLPLVREALRMMNGEAEAKNIRLLIETRGDLATAPPVYGDADRITQVLVNLLSNGVKYTPAGGVITVFVEFADSLVTTCVADTGIGISPEDQDRLFQKFFRADNSTTRETGGTGLGLAITKAILEKLGGSVWVESEPGKGSKFWFTLPAADSEPVVDPNEPHHLVLNIDGDTTLLHRMGHELRMQGYVTSNAATLAEAQRRARGLRPDMITLSLLAPNLDGITVLRALRQNPTTAPIPVVFMSIHQFGGRLEAVDTISYLPTNASEEQLAPALKTALNPMRSRREVVLVVGGTETIERVRQTLAGRGPGIRLMTAATTEEALDRIAESFPDLTVIDTTTPDLSPGVVAARLQERRPTEHIPLVVLMEPELLAGAISFLPQTGAGSVPLSRLGLHLRRLLRGKSSPSHSDAMQAEQALHAEVIAV